MNPITPSQAPINTRHAWRPVLKPIGRLLIAAHLALALQPLRLLSGTAVRALVRLLSKSCASS